MNENFKLVILNGANCSPEFLASYREVYSHWKKMWQTTFQELEGQSAINSDNFSRQDEILALFHQNRCVAVACHRYSDIRLPSLMDDTYFLSWPEETKKKVQQMKGKFAIGNQISIDPGFRKMPDGTAMKDVLLWFSLNRLKLQEIDFVLGAVREDKALDKLFVKYGARILQKNVQLHNVPVALVYFQRNEINLQSPDLPILWLSKIYAQREEDPQSNLKFLTTLQKEHVVTPLQNLLNFHETEMKKTTKIMHSCPWENQEFYMQWCAQFFFFVAHATRLLSASAARLDLNRDSLHLRFLDHCQEEKNHEKLFAMDLAFFNKKPTDFEEHPLAALLYQSQYYLIDYIDPMALFGSILFLEGMSISAGTDIYKRLSSKYTDQACHFVKIHVHDDQDHIIKAKKALANMSDKELHVITTSYRQSSYAFNTLLEELKMNCLNSHAKEIEPKLKKAS